MRRSIPTRYRGILFRSKLEADWALAFDTLGIDWTYEREGLQLPDVFYLPDFHLSRSGQYVEVKGQESPEDVRKWHALVHYLTARPHTGEWTPDIPLVIAKPAGVFFGYTRDSSSDFHGFMLDHAKDTALLRCRQCRGWWFAHAAGSYRCQCCGAYDGRGHLIDLITSPMTGFPRSVDLVA